MLAAAVYEPMRRIQLEPQYCHGSQGTSGRSRVTTHVLEHITYFLCLSSCQLSVNRSPLSRPQAKKLIIHMHGTPTLEWMQR